MGNGSALQLRTFLISEVRETKGRKREGKNRDNCTTVRARKSVRHLYMKPLSPEYRDQAEPHKEPIGQHTLILQEH